MCLLLPSVSIYLVSKTPIFLLRKSFSSSGLISPSAFSHLSFSRCFYLDNKTEMYFDSQSSSSFLRKFLRKPASRHTVLGSDLLNCHLNFWVDSNFTEVCLCFFLRGGVCLLVFLKNINPRRWNSFYKIMTPIPF